MGDRARAGSARGRVGAFALAAAFSTLALSPTPSFAQQPGEVKATHGAWSTVCDKPAGAATEQCAIIQFVIADDRPEIGLSVAVFKTADKKTQMLKVLAPLGVLLPKGLGLYVDNKEIGRAYFDFCYSDGCSVQVTLQDDLLKTLRNGKSAVFTIYDTQEPGSGIGLPIDLTGFGEGLDSLQ